jgi:uncharacterized protein YqgV (UPF0045/DUF77 family)
MVLLDFSMTPIGKGESVSPYVARCLEVVGASGLDYRLHATLRHFAHDFSMQVNCPLLQRSS